jgi:hypothetical protein
MKFLRIGCLLSLILFLSLQAASAATKPPIPVGRVVWIKGTLKAVMSNDEVRILKEKSIIYLHDTLITDASSRAEIGFTDQTLITLRESTTFTVDQYQYAPGGKKKGGASVMGLIEGGFRTITGAVAKDTPNNYAVNTPVATIGVRGTEYQAYIQNGVTYLGYFSGTPCIRINKEICDNFKRKFPDKYKQQVKANEDKKTSPEICLNKKVRWAKIAGPCANPEPLNEKPDVFNNDIDITPATIESFELTYGPPPPSGQKEVNSFCIR